VRIAPRGKRKGQNSIRTNDIVRDIPSSFEWFQLPAPFLSRGLTMRYRAMKREDVDEVLRVRTLTRENALTTEQLAGLGITPESTRDLLGDDVKGWVCEESGAILGFAMGDALSGEVLVLAVLAQHEGRGIGRELLGTVRDWLFSRGHSGLWLLTNPDPAVRSHGFYRRLGWRPTGERRGRDEVLRLRRDRHA